MAEELFDYQTELKTLRETAEAHATPYRAEEPVAAGLSELKKLYAERFTRTKPHLMFYGLYNAGKSSLMNELLGRDEAKVADKPTTDRVDRYEWRGYELFDTPGVGAPIEHERVTQQQLADADVVLFVMSTTGSNERRQNYERMKDILAAGKKIIIVLNDKNGDLGQKDGEAKLSEIRAKVVANMEALGIEDAREKYLIVFVNAKRARAGRLLIEQAKGAAEREELLRRGSGLRERSNIGELTNIILQELKKTNAFSLLAGASLDAEKCVDGIAAAIAALGEGEQDAQEFLKTVAQGRRNLRETMQGYLARQEQGLAAALYDAVWGNRENEGKLQDAVHAAQTAVAQKIVRKLSTETKNFLQDLELEAQNFAAPDLSAKATDVSFDFSAVLANLRKLLADYEKQTEETAESGTGGAAEFGTKMAAGAAAGAAAQQAAKEFAKSAVGKAVLSTAGGKFLAPLIPVVGPIITIATTLKTLADFLGGNGELEKQKAAVAAANERARQHAAAVAQAQAELRQKAGYLAGELMDSFAQGIDRAIQDLVAQAEQPFRDAAQKAREKGKAVASDAAALRETADRYHALAARLQTR